MNEPKNTKPLSYWPNEYVSVSALQSFESCPVSFFLHYFCGVEWKANKNMKLGTIFQNALNAKYKGEDYTEIIKTIEGPDGKIAQDLIKLANKFEGIVSIDTPYVVDFGLGIDVKFVPDLLIKNEKYTCIENKYSGGYYNEDMVHKQMQGRVYSYGLHKVFGEEPEVRYQIFNKKNKTVKLIDVKYDNTDIAEMISWILSTLGRVRRCFESDNWVIHQHSKYPCNLGNEACPIISIL